MKQFSEVQLDFWVRLQSTYDLSAAKKGFLENAQRLSAMILPAKKNTTLDEILGKNYAYSAAKQNYWKSLMRLSPKAFFLLALALICNTARSQTTTKSIVSKNLLGTWIGILGQTDEDKEPVKIVWRVHSIDAAKAQVELTDMGQRFHDGAEIENPLKQKYKGTYRDSVFIIKFDKQSTKLTFTFKVKRNGLDDRLLLIGKATAGYDDNQKPIGFHLVKINDDISKYVKPKKGSIEVTTTPLSKTGH